MTQQPNLPGSHYSHSSGARIQPLLVMTFSRSRLQLLLVLRPEAAEAPEKQEIVNNLNAARQEECPPACGDYACTMHL